MCNAGSSSRRWDSLNSIARRYLSKVDPWLSAQHMWPLHRHDTSVNSLAPEKFEWNFRHVIFKQILVIDGWCICCEIALIWMSLDFADDQSTLVQVMAWCRQATSHYLSQCWPRSMSPYGVTGPQWVNSYQITCNSTVCLAACLS